MDATQFADLYQLGEYAAGLLVACIFAISLKGSGL